MLTAYPAETQAADRLHEAVWIDLQAPTDEEMAQVSEATGLRVPSREEVSAIEASSRLQRTREALYLSTSMLVVGDAPHLTPVGFVLSRQRLITVRFDALFAFDTAAQNARGDEEITSLGVFTCVFEAIVDRVADGLEQMAGELDGVSRSIFHPDGPRPSPNRNEAHQRQVLREVGRIGERLSQIRDVLLGVARIVPFVIEVRHAGQDDGITDRLKAVRQDVSSLNDYEAQLADKVQFLLDAVLGFINISQNDIFKVLTVWSIVGIPPTLMAGVWGMNFKAMPELNWAWGYPMALAVIVLSALVPLAWFKWKGWV
ncbi:MAG TPA: magnesium transporter CorA family protein [Caulobacteraceae bacterium]|nr:magnesium transporter CorA family protein [Caulobacteraceae bacterium]